jgi:hypothetical protein
MSVMRAALTRGQLAATRMVRYAEPPGILAKA